MNDRRLWLLFSQITDKAYITASDLGKQCSEGPEHTKAVMIRMGKLNMSDVCMKRMSFMIWKKIRWNYTM